MDHFKYLRENNVGFIELPVYKDRFLRFECITQVLAPPYLEVGLPSNTLTTYKVMPGAESECLLHFDAASEVLCILACVDEVMTPQKLRLSCFKTITQAQKRQYFRVDTEVAVDLQHFAGKRAASMVGESINISASGILVSFPEPLEKKKGIWLEIELPEPQNRDIRCICHVVRISKGSAGDHQVAFHFDKMNPKDREDLISFCLTQQRKQLRLKVRILG